MNGAWIAVASAEHVRRGREGGFMQVCHGKATPLRRVQPGDGVIYYSPTITFGSKVPYRAFTAAGVAGPGEPYLFDAGNGFRPWRRGVRWDSAREIPAASILERLSFAAGRRNWAYGLRFGLMAIPVQDFGVLLAEMRNPTDRQASLPGVGAILAPATPCRSDAP